MVSIVMPAFNEAANIEAAVREWHDEVAAKLPGAEIVVVDDASSDATPAILDSLAKDLTQLRVIHSSQNRGHGPTVRAGLEAALQPWVFQTDSDRQHLASEFWLSWNRREEADFVFGARKTREDGAFRRMITFLMRIANAIIWGEWIRDANCPFKLMRAEKLRQVLARIPHDVFIPMVFIAILARKMKMRVVEIEVTHLPRKGGTTSLRGIARWVKIGFTCLGQIAALRLRWRTS